MNQLKNFLRKMGKCLYSFFTAIAATMLLSACMTDDSVLSGNDDIKTAMTFTAAHEPDGDGGRAEFANDGRHVRLPPDREIPWTGHSKESVA